MKRVFFSWVFLISLNLFASDLSNEFNQEPEFKETYEHSIRLKANLVRSSFSRDQYVETYDDTDELQFKFDEEYLNKPNRRTTYVFMPRTVSNPLDQQDDQFPC